MKRGELEMDITKTGVIIAIVIFLCSSLGYSQELSDQERNIFYEAAWVMLQADYQYMTDSSEAMAQRFSS